MFSRKNEVERTAEQAWDYLSSAWQAAGDTAREAGRQTAGAASDLGGKASDLTARTGRKAKKANKRASKKSHEIGTEAWGRANAAAAALAGHRPGRPWGLIAVVALAGVAVGWFASTAAKATLAEQRAAEEDELAETALIVTPGAGAPAPDARDL